MRFFLCSFFGFSSKRIILLLNTKLNIDDDWQRTSDTERNITISFMSKLETLSRGGHKASTRYLVWFVRVIKIYTFIWFVKNEYLQFQVLAHNSLLADYLPRFIIFYLRVLANYLRVTCGLFACNLLLFVLLFIT